MADLSGYITGTPFWKKGVPDLYQNFYGCYGIA
jgi:hypothetical protein